MPNLKLTRAENSHVSQNSRIPGNSFFKGRGCELGAKSTIVSFIVFSTLVPLRVHQVYISIIRMNDFRGILKIAKTKKQVM